jgi:hypothetical protein
MTKLKITDLRNMLEVPGDGYMAILYNIYVLNLDDEANTYLKYVFASEDFDHLGFINQALDFYLLPRQLTNSYDYPHVNKIEFSNLFYFEAYSDLLRKFDVDNIVFKAIFAELFALPSAYFVNEKYAEELENFIVVIRDNLNGSKNLRFLALWFMLNLRIMVMYDQDLNKTLKPRPWQQYFPDPLTFHHQLATSLDLKASDVLRFITKHILLFKILYPFLGKAPFVFKNADGVSWGTLNTGLTGDQKLDEFFFVPGIDDHPQAQDPQT